MLHAGAATRDISPPKPTSLYGYPHVARVSTGVHDPLLATVLVLKNADAMVVLVSLDLLMVEPPYARELRETVAEAVGCDKSGVFVGCTHTHSGPVTSRLIGWQNDPAVPDPDSDHLQLVKTLVADAAAEAVQSPIPAELAWSAADATGVGGNRLGEDGITDPECGVLALRSKDDRTMLAMALVYGMHPTVLHEDSTLISGDFPSFTRRHVQEHLGDAIPIAYFLAPSGNQSPRRFVREQTFEEAERLGCKLGAAVCCAIDELVDEDWHPTAQLSGRRTTVELPRNRIRSLPEAEALLEECRTHYEKLWRGNAPRADVRTAECAIFGAEATLTLAQTEARGELSARVRDYLPAEVQALQVGRVCLIGLPGECFTEYGLEIKRRAKRRTFVASLVNGDLQGYIVTPDAAAAGGYEAANAVFAPESGSILVDAALDLASRLASGDET